MRPEGECTLLRGLTFWELNPPVGLSEDPSSTGINQDSIQRPRRKQSIRVPRSRLCLLKGCNRKFRPEHPRIRYCSNACSQQAERWSRWKAQQHYRANEPGKAKRQAQSRRYRQRLKAKKAEPPGAPAGGARVITQNFFSMAPVTVPDATRRLRIAVGRRYSGFAVASVEGPWSVCWRGSGSGASAGLNRDRDYDFEHKRIRSP